MRLHLASLAARPLAPSSPRPTLCRRRRAAKNDCGAVAELVKLCSQDKGAAELAAFAQSKQAEFEQVGHVEGGGDAGCAAARCVCGPCQASRRAA